MHAAAARAPRGGRERRVSLRKPVVVRSDRRPACRHSGGLLDGPIGFPKAHPSLPPGERAVRVRTETLGAGGRGPQAGGRGCYPARDRMNGKIVYEAPRVAAAPGETVVTSTCG